MQATTGKMTFALELMLDAEKLVTKQEFTIASAAEKVGVDKEKLRSWITAKQNWRKADTTILDDAEVAREEVDKLKDQCARLLRTKQFLCNSRPPAVQQVKPENKHKRRSFRQTRRFSNAVSNKVPELLMA